MGMRGRITCFAVFLALAGAGCAHAEFNPCPMALADASAAPAADPDELVFAAYSFHTHYNPAHRPVFLVGYDHYLPGSWFCGASVFRNSFGQPSAYVFVGKVWDEFWSAHPRWSFALTGGILWGYKGQFKDQVPLNFHGYSPGVIPDLGYRLTDRDRLHLYTGGLEAFMLGYSHRF
jgi:hypothetical protein